MVVVPLAMVAGAVFGWASGLAIGALALLGAYAIGSMAVMDQVVTAARLIEIVASAAGASLAGWLAAPGTVGSGD